MQLLLHIENIYHLITITFVFNIIIIPEITFSFQFITFLLIAQNNLIILIIQLIINLSLISFFSLISFLFFFFFCFMKCWNISDYFIFNHFIYNFFFFFLFRLLLPFGLLSFFRLLNNVYVGAFILKRLITLGSGKQFINRSYHVSLTDHTIVFNGPYFLYFFLFKLIHIIYRHNNRFKK